MAEIVTRSVSEDESATHCIPRLRFGLLCHGSTLKVNLDRALVSVPLMYAHITSTDVRVYPESLNTVTRLFVRHYVIQREDRPFRHQRKLTGIYRFPLSAFRFSFDTQDPYPTLPLRLIPEYCFRIASKSQRRFSDSSPAAFISLRRPNIQGEQIQRREYY